MTNYLPKASTGKMVRSPGPVVAGFGLDDGEVFPAPCRRCFMGYLVVEHYTSTGDL